MTLLAKDCGIRAGHQVIGADARDASAQGDAMKKRLANVLARLLKGNVINR